MAYGARRGHSDWLLKKHVDSLRQATIFAAEIDHPLNLWVIIAWHRTDLGDDADGRVLDWLMEQARHWLKRHGVSAFAWLEVRERPRGPPRPNDNIVVHCPPRLCEAFQGQMIGWITRYCRMLDDRAVMFQRVGNGNPTLAAGLGVVAYLSKGLSPTTAKRLGIRHEDQGRVYGKRIGISQDLGPAARRRHAARFAEHLSRAA